MLGAARLSCSSWFLKRRPCPCPCPTSSFTLRRGLAQSTPESESSHWSPHDMQKQLDDKPTTKPSSYPRDTMSSLGEAYATRSEEEGFGGIYGGSQYFSQEEDTGSEDKQRHTGTVNPPGLDESQGSEVKEKEKGRHQHKVDP